MYGGVCCQHPGQGVQHGAASPRCQALVDVHPTEKRWAATRNHTRAQHRSCTVIYVLLILTMRSCIASRQCTPCPAQPTFASLYLYTGDMFTSTGQLQPLVLLLRCAHQMQMAMPCMKDLQTPCSKLSVVCSCRARGLFRHPSTSR